MIPSLGIHRLDDNIELPFYATAASACFDLKAYIGPEDNGILIEPGETVLVRTGLIFDIPKGYSIRLHPRSGLSLKSGIVLGNCEGIIDEDYVEEVKIILYNRGSESFEVQNGMKLCQGEMVYDLRANIINIEEPPKQKTDRTGGFGSTGVK